MIHDYHVSFSLIIRVIIVNNVNDTLNIDNDGDVIMTTMASQITSLTVVYSIVYSDAEQRKHQSSAPLTSVRGIPR